MAERICTVYAIIITTVFSAPVSIENDLSYFQASTQENFSELKKYLDEINFLVEQEYIVPWDPLIQERFPDVFQTKNGTEATLADYLFQGDMLLTPNQAKEILDDLKLSIRKKFSFKNEEKFRVKRKFYSAVAAKWTIFPIPFKIHPYLRDISDGIFKAIRILEDNTCLRFAEINYYDNREQDYIEFDRKKGCFSNYGRLGGKNLISIGFMCEKVGIIAHEIGHSLGLTHEQSRPDRDCCVRIKPQNIFRSGFTFFVKLGENLVDTFGTPYDLGSVMHYSGIGFAVDPSQNSLETKLPGFQKTIGQREQLSFYDIEIINEAYDCKKKCRAILPCKHGGYAHPNLCDMCLCPDGLSGQYCQVHEQPKEANCGGTILLDGFGEVISSPGYLDYQGYQKNQKCSWLFTAPEGKRITMEFVDQFEFYCERICYDYVEVKNSTDLANTGMRFCCFEAPGELIYSSGRNMLIIFKAATNYNYRGFKARLSIYPNEEEPQPLPEVTTTKKPIGVPALKLKIGEVDFSGWSEWGAWSECSQSCGACGVKQKRRTCLKPPCMGESKTNRRCGFHLCPGMSGCKKIVKKDDRCGIWTHGICTKSVQLLLDCPNNATCCPPFEVEDNMCRLPSDQRGSWSQWTEWGDCVGPLCGGCAVRARRRICNDLICQGSELEHKRCNTRACDTCADRPSCYCCQPLKRTWFGECRMSLV